jgi:hypothetical protein
MRLTIRPTGGHSPVYVGRQDWTILGDGRQLAAFTRTRPRARPPITVYVWPDAGIVTSGKTARIDQAKAAFQRSLFAWTKAGGVR